MNATHLQAIASQHIAQIPEGMIGAEEALVHYRDLRPALERAGATRRQIERWLKSWIRVVRPDVPVETHAMIARAVCDVFGYELLIDHQRRRCFLQPHQVQ